MTRGCRDKPSSSGRHCRSRPDRPCLDGPRRESSCLASWSPQSRHRERRDERRQPPHTDVDEARSSTSPNPCWTGNCRRTHSSPRRKPSPSSCNRR